MGFWHPNHFIFIYISDTALIGVICTRYVETVFKMVNFFIIMVAYRYTIVSTLNLFSSFIICAILKIIIIIQTFKTTKKTVSY